MPAVGKHTEKKSDESIWLPHKLLCWSGLSCPSESSCLFLSFDTSELSGQSKSLGPFRLLDPCVLLCWFRSSSLCMLLCWFGSFGPFGSMG